MDEHPAEPWPTLLFRPLHPVEAALVRRLLGVEEADALLVYVLVEAGGSVDDRPEAAVALEARDGTWLLRSAYGVDDPLVAARVGCELLAEAVRAGASTIAAPVEATPACRAVLGDGRGSPRNGWLVAEL